MSSPFVRSALPWVHYYSFNTSPMKMNPFFLVMYLLMKLVIVIQLCGHVFALVRQFCSSDLEYGTRISPDAWMESGSPECPICYDAMTNPVQLSCDHLFCEACVFEWLDRERTCPLCRADVSMGHNPVPYVSRLYLKINYCDGSTSLLPQLM